MNATNTQAVIERTKAAVARVENWNREDVHELRDLLRDLRGALFEESELCNYYHPFRLDEVIDIGQLPTEPFPDELDTGYPISAVDRAGNALVGDALDEIEAVADILAYYKEIGNAA